MTDDTKRGTPEHGGANRNGSGGERRYGKPMGAGTGARAGSSGGARSYGRPAGAGAGAGAGGERKFSRPA
ncbi:MAG: hypothetical protein RR301_03940, partial [Clostridia bacterium]